jgi:hypothetical protein
MGFDDNRDVWLNQVAEWEEEQRYQEYKEKDYAAYKERLRLMDIDISFYNSRYNSGYLKYIYYTFGDLFYSLFYCCFGSVELTHQDTESVFHPKSAVI